VGRKVYESIIQLGSNKQTKVYSMAKTTLVFDGAASRKFSMLLHWSSVLE